MWRTEGLNKTKPWLGMSLVSAFGGLRQEDDHEAGARMGNMMSSRQAWAAECGSVQGSGAAFPGQEIQSK